MIDVLPQLLLSNYQPKEDFFDEAYTADSQIREHYQRLIQHINQYSQVDFKRINDYAKATFFNQGITFAVYSEQEKGVERIFPFDLIPRIIPNQEWQIIEKGVIQRNMAINAFLQDIYHEKLILRNKVIPPDLILSCNFYNKHMMGFKPVAGIYNHISGTDIIKHSDGNYYVLEDNVRCPSGVSYIISNRQVMKKGLTSLFSSYDILPVEDYAQQLITMMLSVAPEGIDDPVCVVLTPGIYNSAYYEHSYLSLAMGIPLVEGRDLFVDNNFVYMKTIYGPKRVDVIYRRVDDIYLDPLVFNPNSVLGVPGLLGAYRSGNVNIINAIGTGVADDKAIYRFVPDMIKYYLGEEPILNNVQTYECSNDDDYKYVLENMDKLVVKPVDESGGYGILIGTKATKEEISDYKKVIAGNRRKYIAQSIMSLSTVPTFAEDTETFEPRHTDLRTYCLIGRDQQFLVKGALSRVALKRGSLIVNSSQGGGSKDTWVLE